MVQQRPRHNIHRGTDRAIADETWQLTNFFLRNTRQDRAGEKTSRRLFRENKGLRPRANWAVIECWRVLHQQTGYQYTPGGSGASPTLTLLPIDECAGTPPLERLRFAGTVSGRVAGATGLSQVVDFVMWFS